MTHRAFWPPASDECTRRRMTSTRRQDTSAEIAVSAALDKLGLTYETNLRPLDSLRAKADMVFTAARVAVFVDGCFWHGCPYHRTIPRANGDWWRQKIERTRLRDSETTRRLSDAGWLAIRVWEHDDPVRAAAKIRRTVQLRHATLGDQAP